jgi:hypothetical protein
MDEAEEVEKPVGLRLFTGIGLVEHNEDSAFELTVHTPQDDLTITVEKSDNIYAVKDKIYIITHIQARLQILSVDGLELDNDDTLEIF